MLLLSLLTLFAGPAIYHWMKKGGLIAKTVDRVIVAVLVVLVVFLLVPETISTLGVLALGLIAAGYLLPGLLESGLRNSAETWHLVSVFAALSGLVVHAMLDGAGLAGGGQGDHSQLATAIVIHRFGTGLVLWLIVQPVFGRKIASGILLLMAVATLFGFYLSETVLPLAGQNAVVVVEALIIGTIVHSLVHRGHVGRHGH